MCCTSDVDCECDWLSELVTVADPNTFLDVILDPDFIIYTVSFGDTLTHDFYECFEDRVPNIYSWCFYIPDTLSTFIEFCDANYYWNG